MDRGAWWAAVYRVTHSWTQLKHLSMHACIGEGNGNPLQCSCLENPRDGGAWWAAVYGVTQNWTRLMRLSSSSRQLTIMSLINCKKKIKKEFLSFHALIFPNNNLQFSQKISCMSFVMYSLKYFTLLLIQMHFLYLICHLSIANP